MNVKIRFNHVFFSYGKKQKNALNDVNLCFENVFIMGATGSGKSTLVQHLNGLLLCKEGDVKIDIQNNEFILNKNNRIATINDLRKEIGLVFQFPEYQLFETTVIKDVMFGPYNFHKDENKAKEMAIKALNKVGINESYYERSPFDLSGGEKRKVAIAGVLASDPSVIVMDEPTSSLDPLSTKEMMCLIKELKDEGKTIIVISHDVDLCYEYADRVVIMNNGEIMLDSKPDKAFSDKDVLNKACLQEPFINKAKRILGIEDISIRNINSLKEVIKNG